MPKYIELSAGETIVTAELFGSSKCSNEKREEEDTKDGSN